MPFSTVANTGVFALNAPASSTLPTKAVHTLTWANSGHTVTVGDIFVINDGVNPAVTFELVTNAGDAPSVAGRIPVVLNSSVDATMATNAKNAINAVADRGLLDVVATTSTADTLVTYYEGCVPVLATKTLTNAAAMTIANTTAAAAGAPGEMLRFRVIKGGKLTCTVENNIGENTLAGLYFYASTDGIGWYATKAGATYGGIAGSVNASVAVKEKKDFTIQLRPTDKYLRVLGSGPCRAELQVRGDAILEVMAGKW